MTIPLRNGEDDQRVKLLFHDVFFKIYETDYSEKSYSLGLHLKGENKEIMEEIEKHISSLAMKTRPEVRKLNAGCSSFNESSFKIVKTDKSGKPKLFGKLYLTNGKINTPFFQGKTKCNRRKIKWWYIRRDLSADFGMHRIVALTAVRATI